MNNNLLDLSSSQSLAGQGPWNHTAGLLLQAASRSLAQLARLMRNPQRRIVLQHQSELEFYAEAGAPEGALYVNGEYVGSLHGINRL